LVLLLGVALLGAEARDASLARLTKILREAPEFRLRVSAARALGILKDPAALPALITAIGTDPDNLVKGAAAWALGNINHPGALGVLDKASSLENAFAAGQARRAAAHIRLKLPGNLPPFAQGWWRIDTRQLTVAAGASGALKAALPVELAARLASKANVELAGQPPVPANADKPFIGLRLGGGLKNALAAPGGRGTCRVTVEAWLTLEGQQVPVTRRVERLGTAEAGPNLNTEQALLAALGVALDGLVTDLLASIGTRGGP
jgi:hypothetical protein